MALVDLSLVFLILYIFPPKRAIGQSRAKLFCGALAWMRRLRARHDPSMPTATPLQKIDTTVIGLS